MPGLSIATSPTRLSAYPDKSGSGATPDAIKRYIILAITSFGCQLYRQDIYFGPGMRSSGFFIGPIGLEKSVVFWSPNDINFERILTHKGFTELFYGQLKRELLPESTKETNK